MIHSYDTIKEQPTKLKIAPTKTNKPQQNIVGRFNPSGKRGMWQPYFV